MKVVACYGRRYEPDWLVEEMLANIEGICDDIFCLDDRARSESDLWIGREEFNLALRNGARKKGADYMLVIAPDERLERRAGQVIRTLVDSDRQLSYGFDLREMYTPTAYRVDGIWGKKKRIRLHRLSNRSGEVGLERHDLNIYHLKHIEPANRLSRAEIHKLTNTVDNRELGFDYLADERGMILQEIEPGREFTPPYTRPYIFSIERAA